MQDERAADIIRKYVYILRPKSNDPQLLLQHTGKPLKQGSVTRYIMSYFQKNAGYNLGVNSLRRVQCSEVYVASIDGRVTESARRQYNFVQGHSDRINNTVYVRLAMQANSDIARETFSKLGLKRNTPLASAELSSSSQSQVDTPHLSQPELASSSQSQVGTPSRRDINGIASSQPKPNIPYAEPYEYLNYNDWGIAHSCANKVGDRIPWDTKEKECLRNIYETKRQSFDSYTDKWKQLLNAVAEDPKARPLFHRHHVSDYSRLRDVLREKRVTLKRKAIFE